MAGGPQTGAGRVYYRAASYVDLEPPIHLPRIPGHGEGQHVRGIDRSGGAAVTFLFCAVPSVPVGQIEFFHDVRSGFRVPCGGLRDPCVHL